MNIIPIDLAPPKQVPPQSPFKPGLFVRLWKPSGEVIRQVDKVFSNGDFNLVSEPDIRHWRPRFYPHPTTREMAWEAYKVGDKYARGMVWPADQAKPE